MIITHLTFSRLNAPTAVLLIFIALLNSTLAIFIYKPPVANAFLGVDIAHLFATIGGWLKSAAYWIWDKLVIAAEWAWNKATFLWEKSQKMREWIWKTTLEASKSAWEVVKKKSLDFAVNHLTNYIQYGGREGGPSFIPDWKTFLYGTGGALDQARGEFANIFWQNITADLTPEVRAEMEKRGISTTNLCEIEPKSWTTILGLEVGGEAPIEKFTSDDVACTAREAKDNLLEAKEQLKAFYEDFEGGGWETWLEVSTVPQNNIYGFYLTALDKKLGIEGETVEAEKNKAIAGTGWLGKEQCTTYVNNLLNNKPRVSDISYDPTTGKLLGMNWISTINESIAFSTEGVNKINKNTFNDDIVGHEKNPDEAYNPIENALWKNYKFPTGTDIGSKYPTVERDAFIIYNFLNGLSDAAKQHGFKCTNWNTLTPGQVIGQSVAKSFGGEIDWLVNADEMEGYTKALVNAGINRLFSEGRGLLGKWKGDDKEAKDLEGGYQDTIGSLPHATSDAATKRNLDTATDNYNAIGKFQESLFGSESDSEDFLRMAETPAEELLFALEDLESALSKKLKPAYETKLRLQDKDLQNLQENALVTTLNYHFGKNVFNYSRFARSEDMGDHANQTEKCFNSELDGKYYIDYKENADWDIGAEGNQNPLIYLGKDTRDSLRGSYVWGETFDLVVENIGKVLKISVEYPTLDLGSYLSDPEKSISSTCSSSSRCIKYDQNSIHKKAGLETEITDENRNILTKKLEQFEIHDVEDIIFHNDLPAANYSWLDIILLAKNKLTEISDYDSQINFLQAHKMYKDVYSWASDPNSPEGMKISKGESAGLQNLRSNAINLQDWKYRDVNDAQANDFELEKELRKGGYEETEVIMEAIRAIGLECRNNGNCTEEEKQAKDVIRAKTKQAVETYKTALTYSLSPESPSLNFFKSKDEFLDALFVNKVVAGNPPIDPLIKQWTGETIELDENKIDFYKEFIGLDRIKNLISSSRDEIIDYAILAIKSTNNRINSELDLKELQKKNISDLSQVIQGIQDSTNKVKDEVNEISDELRRMSPESSTDSIVQAAYQNKLQAILGLYNKAYSKWKECVGELGGDVD